MEIILGLVVVAVVGYFVFFRKPAEAVVETAPYKVEEAPAVSPVAEQASEAVVTSIAPAKKPRATKATAAKKVAVKKPAVKKPAKKVVKAK
jgi:hypothetical protein